MPNKMIYVKQWGGFVSETLWNEVKKLAREARQSPATPPIRDSKEVKIFEADLKKNQIIQ